MNACYLLLVTFHSVGRLMYRGERIFLQLDNTLQNNVVTSSSAITSITTDDFVTNNAITSGFSNLMINKPLLLSATPDLLIPVSL